jgi:hypothetical protein
MTSRRRLLLGATVGVLGVLGIGRAIYRPFPSDRTPEGAYMRIAKSITDGHDREMFPYLETEAQWASYTIRDMRKAAYDRAQKSYPEPARSALMDAYRAHAQAPDGSDLFQIMSQERGFARRLRKDLSGVASVEISGERASVVTTRGTRYPFRRRDNGIWGLTIFTAELLAEANRASRDFDMVKHAADDYDRQK